MEGCVGGGPDDRPVSAILPAPEGCRTLAGVRQPPVGSPNGLRPSRGAGRAHRPSDSAAPAGAPAGPIAAAAAPTAAELLGEDLNDVYDGEPPGFGFLVIDAADFVAFEDGEVFVHGEGRLEARAKLGGEFVSHPTTSVAALPRSRRLSQNGRCNHNHQTKRIPEK